jgi:hypothetical protein
MQWSQRTVNAFEQTTWHATPFFSSLIASALIGVGEWRVRLGLSNMDTGLTTLMSEHTHDLFSWSIHDHNVWHAVLHKQERQGFMGFWFPFHWKCPCSPTVRGAVQLSLPIATFWNHMGLHCISKTFNWQPSVSQLAIVCTETTGKGRMGSCSNSSLRGRPDGSVGHFESDALVPRKGGSVNSSLCGLGLNPGNPYCAPEV